MGRSVFLQFVWKQYRQLAKWRFAPAYFLATYILKKGFLDNRIKGGASHGRPRKKAIYFYQIRLKIFESRLSITD